MIKMRFRNLFLLIIGVTGMAMMTSCNNKNDEPDPENLYGSWIRTYNGTESYSAQLNLLKSGDFEWIVLDTLSSHSNSMVKFEITGNKVRIYNDPEIIEEGLYEWSVSGDKLTFTEVDDGFAPRVAAVAGTWNLKNPADFAPVIGSWQKTVVELDVPYRVKLSMDNEGLLTWEMIDPIPGHTNSSVSYVATAGTIVIYNDPDCDGNGYFTWTVTGDELTCTYLKDKCPARTQSFSGTWSKLMSNQE